MIKTFIKIYTSVKNFCTDNPNNLLSVISSSILLFIVQLILFSVHQIFINDLYSVQHIIYIISAIMLYSGINVGYIKFIFHKIDKKNKKILDVFNYFEILPQYIIGIILQFLLIIVACIPSLIYIQLKYGLDKMNTISEIILNNDPNFTALLDPYFNAFDINIILFLMAAPIIIVVLKTFFMNFYIIDKRCSPLIALKNSIKITKNQKLNITLYLILLLLLNFIIGILSFGLGEIIMLPLSHLFFCQYFRLLIIKKRKNINE